MTVKIARPTPNLFYTLQPAVVAPSNASEAIDEPTATGCAVSWRWRAWLQPAALSVGP